MSSDEEKNYESSDTKLESLNKLSCHIPWEKPEGVSDNAFDKLLQELAFEHERALRALQLENQRLRSELAHRSPRPPPEPPSRGMAGQEKILHCVNPPLDAPPGWQRAQGTVSAEASAATNAALKNGIEPAPALTRQSVVQSVASKTAPQRAKRATSVEFDLRTLRKDETSMEGLWSSEGSASMGTRDFRRDTTDFNYGRSKMGSFQQPNGHKPHPRSTSLRNGDPFTMCHVIKAPLVHDAHEAASIEPKDDHGDIIAEEGRVSWSLGHETDNQLVDARQDYITKAGSLAPTRWSESSACSGVPVMPSRSPSAQPPRGSRFDRSGSCPFHAGLDRSGSSYNLYGSERSSSEWPGISIEAVATRQVEMNRAFGKSRPSQTASIIAARRDLMNRPSVNKAWSAHRLSVPSGPVSARTSAARTSARSSLDSIKSSESLISNGDACMPNPSMLSQLSQNCPSMLSFDTRDSDCSMGANPSSSNGGMFDDIDSFEIKEAWELSSRVRAKTIAVPSLKMACTIDFDNFPDARPHSGSNRTSLNSNAISWTNVHSQITNFNILSDQAVVPHHMSVLTITWQLSGMCLIFWDVIWLPLQIFEPAESGFVKTMVWSSLLFWTLDLLVSFFSSYSENGVTVSEMKKIANHYLRTWFSFDVLIVTTDWVLVTIDSKLSILGVLRVVRVLRLLRVFKCRRAFEEIHNHINSEYTSIVASIVKLVFMLLIANHFIACAWYGIGRACHDAELPNWLQAGGFSDKSMAYTYTTSMHWSLTQFTPASMEVQPGNVPERIFTIVVIVIALVCFSSFLSSITSSITQLRSMTEDDRRQFWLLRKFFVDSQVPLQLASRITRYLEYATANRKAQVQESQIKILSLLSDQLHNELQCATSVPHVQYHPLFGYINFVSNVTMHRLASKAFSRISLASGDPLFFQGELATLMFFVIDGEFQYILGDIPHWVESSEWMCEPVLWTYWIHPGEMLAMTESEVLSVNADEFGATVQANPAVWKNVREYAEAFCQALNDFNGSMLSDMRCSDPMFEENLCSQLGFLQPPQQKNQSTASYISRLMSAAGPVVTNLWSSSSRKKTSCGRKDGSTGSAFPRNGKSICQVAPG